jgi:hypothetical protein
VGNILWSNGGTYNNINVTAPGTYTVTRTLSGCTSAAGSGVASPTPIPSRPVVSVVNDCGSSTLTTTATGSLVWSNGATTPSITVTTGGTYSVTQTSNGCTSLAGSAVAAPRAVPATPVVTVVNNCVNSTLSIPSGGNILWSNGSTSASITVTTPATYTVTRRLSGCTSAAGSGAATPGTDTQSPTITCIPNTSRTTSTGSYTVAGTEFNAGATDNCAVTAKVYSLSGATVAAFAPGNTSLAGVAFNVGTTTITWRATDASGNQQTCTTNVVVSPASTFTKQAYSNEVNGSEVNLTVKAMPNPTSNYFRLQIKTGGKELLSILVTDLTGRVIEQINGIVPNSTLELGHKYQTGVYMTEIMQGKKRFTLRLIKVK